MAVTTPLSGSSGDRTSIKRIKMAVTTPLSLPGQIVVHGSFEANHLDAIYRQTTKITPIGGVR
jgi:hypothetical protein